MSLVQPLGTRQPLLRTLRRNAANRAAEELGVDRNAVDIDRYNRYIDNIRYRKFRTD